MCNVFHLHVLCKHLNWFPFLLLVIITACNYDPDGEIYTEINPVLPEVNVSLNDQDSVISMWHETNCIYTFSSTPDLRITSVTVFIDNQQVASSTSSRVEFVISPNLYTEGKHVIRITTITKSATGSLADHLGAEEISFTKEWVLMIEKVAPANHFLLITGTANENGLLKISWDKYSSIDFQVYQLFISPTITPDDYLRFDPASPINDSSLNYFYDSSYVGGLRGYHVMLQADGTFYGGYTDMVDTVNFPYPSIISAQSQGCDLHVTFSKCLFPVAFKEYRLSVSPDEYNADIAEVVIPDLNDTTLILHDLPFGKNFTLKLATYPVNIEYNSANLMYEPTSKFISHTGEASFTFAITDVLPSGDMYFMRNYDGGSVYRYSGGTVTEILHNDDEYYFNNSFHVSEDGSYLVYSDYDNQKITLFSLPDMTIVSETAYFNISGNTRVSNNGLVPVWTTHELMIFDLIQNKYIDTLYTNYTGIYQGGMYYGGLSYISPDGEYLYVQTANYYCDSIYHKTDDNNYIVVGALNTNAIFMGYNPLKKGEIIYDENFMQHNIKIFNYETMTTTRTISNLHAPFSNVDPVTGNILALDDINNNMYGLYSLADGSKSGSIRLGNVPIESMLLVNSVLYSSDGTKLKLVP